MKFQNNINKIIWIINLKKNILINKLQLLKDFNHMLINQINNMLVYLKKLN